MIRVAPLDDHPAVLAGLERLIERADGFTLVAAAQDADALVQQLQRTRTDVVILDYQLARGDGLAVCQRLKERVPAPAVVVYSAYAAPALAIAARIAGADALVDKRAPVPDLVDTIRRVAAGAAVLPEITPDVHAAALERLDPDDVAVAAMALAGTSHNGIAEALGTDRRDVRHRIRRIVGRLGSRATSQIAAGAASHPRTPGPRSSSRRDDTPHPSRFKPRLRRLPVLRAERQRRRGDLKPPPTPPRP